MGVWDRRGGSLGEEKGDERRGEAGVGSRGGFRSVDGRGFGGRGVARREPKIVRLVSGLRGHGPLVLRESKGVLTARRVPDSQ